MSIYANDAWLERHTEPVLEPDRVITDPHHHLWRTEDPPPGRYLLRELSSDMDGGHRVERTVFVECGAAYHADGPSARRPLGETAFVAEVAGHSSTAVGPTIAGIVAMADLCAPDVADLLAEHREAAGGRLRGVRYGTAWDASPDVPKARTGAPPGLLGTAEFRRGVAALGGAGLSFDAWMYHTQLDDLVGVAQALPDVAIVLDHLGGPLAIGPYAGDRGRELDRWRAAMGRVAACPNVHLKLGGVGMPMFGATWHEHSEPPSSADIAAAWKDEVTWCVETFAADRCMFESNFPVDRQACSYTVLWNAFKLMAADASEAEKEALFHGTADRFYRLD